MVPHRQIIFRHDMKRKLIIKTNYELLVFKEVSCSKDISF